jgi:hypothetical protein
VLVVIGDNAIAASPVVHRRGCVSFALPIAVISGAPKGGWIIATGRSGIVAAVTQKA